MTSFYADSFEFFSHQQPSICAFLATTRPIFNSSIIPVTLNKTDLWKALGSTVKWVGFTQWKERPLFEVLLLSHTLQFAPTISFHSPHDSSSFQSSTSDFHFNILHHLATKTKYFCRNLRHLKICDSDSLHLICDIAPLVETLDLSGLVNTRNTRNGIDNSDLEAISKLKMLRELNMTSPGGVSLDPQMTDDGLVSHLSELTSLTKLDLSRKHKIHGSGLAALRNMRNLKCLKLVSIHNLNDGDLLRYFPRSLRSIEELALTACRGITVACLDAFSELSLSLVALDISCCDALLTSVEEVLEQLGNFIQLRDLSMEFCPRLNTGSMAETLAESCPRIRKLNVNSCSQLTDVALVALTAHLQQLQSLDVSFAGSVTDLFFEGISKSSQKLQCMTSLNLAGATTLTDAAFARLPESMPNLEILNLTDVSNITDVSMVVLGNKMKHLQEVYFDSNDKITLTGWRALANSASIVYLHFEMCMTISNMAMLYFYQHMKLLRTIGVSTCSGINIENTNEFFFVKDGPDAVSGRRYYGPRDKKRELTQPITDYDD